MNRVVEITKYLKIDGKGIEVAPYFNPVLPKSRYPKVLTLDVFDGAKLRELAIRDPLIPAERIDEIGAVDIIGSATEIATKVQEAGHSGTIDFIVSSHNFEHLPNPIKFLVGCQQILSLNGILSMAIPDGRACFDHFRSPTRLSEWLDAWREDRQRPSPGQIFDGMSLQSFFFKNGRDDPQPGCDLATVSPLNFFPSHLVAEAYERWEMAYVNPSQPYEDAHCSVLIPELMELMLRDLQYLRIVDLEIVEISKTHFHEFFVHLRKPNAPLIINEQHYYRTRAELLRRVVRSIGWAGFGEVSSPPQIASVPEQASVTHRLLSLAHDIIEAVRRRSI